ncbi:MAG: LapA family protein [bacterium]|nr:LapA family protein [bacterium]
MRLLFWLLLVVLVLGILGFLATNLDTTVSLTIWNTEYRDFHLGYVVILSIGIGVLFTSIYAIAEGATARLANRRLRKENAQLETEIKFLRSQQGKTDPDGSPGDGGDDDDRASGSRSLPSAPVYGTTKDDDWRDGASGDDHYTGGSAV